MKQYKNRVIDRLLADKLEAMGAVLIEGPKCSANRLFERLIAFLWHIIKELAPVLIYLSLYKYL